MRCIEKKQDKTSRWATELKQRKHNNIATVAMANKIARTAFALLKYNQNYQVQQLPGTVN